MNGIIVLYSILFLLLIAPVFIPFFIPEQPVDFSRFEEAMRQMELNNQQEKDTAFHQKTEFPANLFPFDPNQLPASEWKKLGLSDKQVAVIKNFEAKGGRFYKKEGLKKIYGISNKEYESLEPYISIKSVEKKSPEIIAKKEPKYESIEINTVDSVSLVALPGIGPILASRIIKYREKLGGFYTLSQLKEVYGLDSLKFNSLLNRIHLNITVIDLIDINTVTLEQLKRHPYCSFRIAKVLINYRDQHGPFTKVEDIKACKALTEEEYLKLKPYLIIDFNLR